MRLILREMKKNPSYTFILNSRNLMTIRTLVTKHTSTLCKMRTQRRGIFCTCFASVALRHTARSFFAFDKSGLGGLCGTAVHVVPNVVVASGVFRHLFHFF
jgi:hypothetical protein